MNHYELRLKKNMNIIVPHHQYFRQVLVCLLFFVGTFQIAAAQEVISIQQAIENTLNNNLQIRQAKLTENLSDENLKQSKAALFPTVNGNGGYNVNFGRSLDPSTQSFNSQQFSSFNGGVSTSVDLFQGFQKLNQIKQNKLLLSADQTYTEKVKNDLILQVITSYMQILYNKDFLVAAKQQLAVAQQQLKQQQELLDVGNKTLADLAESIPGGHRGVGCNYSRKCIDNLLHYACSIDGHSFRHEI